MSSMRREGTSILVTGGTGSFGQKFVEIMLQEWKPSPNTERTLKS